MGQDPYVGSGYDALETENGEVGPRLPCLQFRFGLLHPSDLKMSLLSSISRIKPRKVLRRH